MTDKTIRCIVCRDEFSDEELEGKDYGCPSCGTESLPMHIKKDVSLQINWHELRILTIWATNYAEGQEDSMMMKTLSSIIEGLERQRKDGFAALTLAGELQELAQHPDVKGDVVVTNPDGSEKTVFKKKIPN